MIQTIVYAAGVAGMLIYGIKRRKIMAILLCSLYLLIALFSIVALNKGFLSDENIQMVPYIFMLGSYLVFFYPFISKRNDFNISKLVIKVNRTYVAFAIVYCICGVITLIVFIPSIIRLLASGNWYANRVLFVKGELTYPYSNIIEYLSINICKYLQLLAFIVGFSLIRERRFLPLAYGTLISGALYTTVLSIYTSARGNFVTLFIIVVSIAFFYLKDVSAGNKRFILFICLAGLAAVIPFLIEVTASRFSLTNNGNASIYQYMGQPPLVFNRDVFHITGYAWGTHGLGKLFGDYTFSASDIGGTWGTGFYTFVGYFFIDWGPVGCILVGLILSYLISKTIRKTTYKICDIFLVFVYFNMLSEGVFVIGTRYIFDVIADILIYLFLRFILERYTFVFRRG